MCTGGSYRREEVGAVGGRSCRREEVGAVGAGGAGGAVGGRSCMDVEYWRRRIIYPDLRLMSSS